MPYLTHSIKNRLGVCNLRRIYSDTGDEITALPIVGVVDDIPHMVNPVPELIFFMMRYRSEKRLIGEFRNLENRVLYCENYE